MLLLPSWSLWFLSPPLWSLPAHSLVGRLLLSSMVPPWTHCQESARTQSTMTSEVCCSDHASTATATAVSCTTMESCKPLRRPQIEPSPPQPRSTPLHLHHNAIVLATLIVAAILRTALIASIFRGPSTAIQLSQIRRLAQDDNQPFSLCSSVNPQLEASSALRCSTVASHSLCDTETSSILKAGTTTHYIPVVPITQTQHADSCYCLGHQPRSNRATVSASANTTVCIQPSTSHTREHKHHQGNAISPVPGDNPRSACIASLAPLLTTTTTIRPRSSRNTIVPAPN